MFGKGIGWPEIILILAVVLLLFGAKRLPDTARGLGRSLRIFKAETKGLADDDDASPTPTPPAVLPTTPQVAPTVSSPAHPTVSSPAHPTVSSPAHPTVSSPAHPPGSAPPVSQPEVTPDPGGQR